MHFCGPVCYVVQGGSNLQLYESVDVAMIIITLKLRNSSSTKQIAKILASLKTEELALKSSII